MKGNIVFVCDLDDTLYKEIDFLKSAYKEIAHYIANKTECNLNVNSLYDVLIKAYNNGENAFAKVISTYNLSQITTVDLLNVYRNHKPNIELPNSSHTLLTYLKRTVFKIGLITDGRSRQQRSKIEALGLENFLDDILISEEFGTEKPNLNNFKFYEDKYGKSAHYVYIGDNTKKDFVTPNSLGWTSICLLDDSRNIHKQDFNLPTNFLPKFKIEDLNEVPNILNQI